MLAFKMASFCFACLFLMYVLRLNHFWLTIISGHLSTTWFLNWTQYHMLNTCFCNYLASHVRKKCRWHEKWQHYTFCVSGFSTHDTWTIDNDVFRVWFFLFWHEKFRILLFTCHLMKMVTRIIQGMLDYVPSREIKDTRNGTMIHLRVQRQKYQHE